MVCTSIDSMAVSGTYEVRETCKSSQTDNVKIHMSRTPNSSFQQRVDVCVAVLGRNRTLFRCVIRLRYRLQSAGALTLGVDLSSNQCASSLRVSTH